MISALVKLSQTTPEVVAIGFHNPLVRVSQTTVTDSHSFTKVKCAVLLPECIYFNFFGLKFI